MSAAFVPMDWDWNFLQGLLTTYCSNETSLVPTLNSSGNGSAVVATGAAGMPNIVPGSLEAVW